MLPFSSIVSISFCMYLVLWVAKDGVRILFCSKDWQCKQQKSSHDLPLTVVILKPLQVAYSDELRCFMDPSCIYENCRYRSSGKFILCNISLPRSTQGQLFTGLNLIFTCNFQPSFLRFISETARPWRS
uniref:Uncharacterized protein n=1 Tax=Arundo donax TaxID=35708 RepID=A0A0A9CIF9_ARUDO